MHLATRLVSLLGRLPLGWGLAVAVVLLAPDAGVPEGFQLAGQPATHLLLGSGLLGLTVERRRR